MQRVLEELLFAESHVENTLRVFTPLNVETDDLGRFLTAVSSQATE